MPEIIGVHSDEPAPTPMGGAIASGTYHLTSMTYHLGSSFTCGTLRFRGINEVVAASDTAGTMREVLFSGGTDLRGDYTYQTNGTSFSGPRTCGTPATRTETYTATPNQLLDFRTAPDPFPNGCWPGATLVIIFTKQ